MRFVLKSVLVLVGAFLWIAPGRSRATGRHDESEAAIQRGVEQRKKGDDHQALVEFERAYAIEKSTRALAQIGLAHMALGHWVEASNALEQALESKSDPWIAKNRVTLEGAAKQVDHHVGLVEIEGEPRGATVSLNGAVVGSMPLRSKVGTGEVAISVAAPGYVSLLRKVTVEPESRVRESFTLAILQPAETPPARTGGRESPDLVREAPAQAPASSPHRFGQLPWWTAGAAAVGVGTGTVLALTARNRIADFNKSCGLDPDSGKPVSDPSQTGSTNAQCSGLYDSWKSDKRWAAVTFVAGGVFAATSLALFLLDSPGNESGLKTVAACVPNSFGVACQLRF